MLAIEYFFTVVPQTICLSRKFSAGQVWEEEFCCTSRWTHSVFTWNRDKWCGLFSFLAQNKWYLVYKKTVLFTITILTLLGPERRIYIRSENDQSGFTSMPCSSWWLQNLKKCLSILLLRVKFATKWAFIEVLNLSTKLYRDIWKDVKKLCQFRS